MSAAVIIILNPKNKPKIAAIQAAYPDIHTIDVDVADGASDVQILHAALTELESE